MIAALNHEESWLLLPWLANSRLAQPERMRVEEHVRSCAACAQELELQRLMCVALTEPERVTYAPGPSFRKLAERIDGPPAAAPERRTARVPGSTAPVRSAWRPPGLAFAASLVAALGLAVAAATAYRWSQPLYVTHTAASTRAPGVLHIAFDRTLPIGQVEELLSSAGARVVEGPGTTGIFGVTPADGTRPDSGELQALAQRLRADARVLWVEPLAATDAAAQEPRTRER